MTKKEVRKSPSICMEYFLRTYYDLSNELAEKLAANSHKALKVLAKLYGINLRTICFNDLTRDMLARGEVILITDHFGNAAPYVNPQITIEDEFETTMDERYISYEVYDLNEGDDRYDKYQGRQKVKYFKP